MGRRWGCWVRRVTTWRDWACLGVVLACLASTHWLTLNLSPSVPKGLYRYVAGGPAFVRGDLVVVPAVAFGRPWYARWLSLLKPVAGIPGDTVCVDTEGVRLRYSRQSLGVGLPLWVNFGPVYPEHKGQPLPVFWGCHVVEDGEVFVASRAPKSLDGRYFGMTSVTRARQVVPVWTWGW
jgi:type IV secretory pathway protease TraF